MAIFKKGVVYKDAKKLVKFKTSYGYVKFEKKEGEDGKK
jgi:hypothetical protein